MTMKVLYQVHTAEVQAFAAEVEIGGVLTPVTVTGMVAEPTSLDGTMSKTIRVLPHQLDAARALYTPGRVLAGEDSAPTDQADIDAAAPVEATYAAEADRLAAEKAI